MCVAKTMQQVIRQIILSAVVTACVVPCSGIKILSGSESSKSHYTYDPSNPLTLIWTCADDNGTRIDDAWWSKNNDSINTTGQLILSEDTMCTNHEDPQSYEGNYRCHSGPATSLPVAFYGKTLN